ncbi:unnamed protein product [Porites evermanni]|uniref:Ion transport domain-containing protein n=1 Tax=Porites evermanni TaxID=104178 RepID=A0ABN8Q2H2_9CNID|nr:unnamed protein product [Porites evermanni]
MWSKAILSETVLFILLASVVVIASSLPYYRTLPSSRLNADKSTKEEGCPDPRDLSYCMFEALFKGACLAEKPEKTTVEEKGFKQFNLLSLRSKCFRKNVKNFIAAMDLTNIINLLILVLLTAFATMVTSEVYSDDVDLEQFSELFSKRDAVEGEAKENIEIRGKQNELFPEGPVFK